VVEAASQEAVKEHAEKLLERGYNLMIMSVGALVDEGLFHRLKKAAEKSGVKIILPSGAIAGLDGLRSAAVGKIREVTLTTTKPPKGFDMELAEAKVLYTGDAAEAVRKFPKNVNVAATLSLAGIGFEKTKVKLVADPGVAENRHEISVKGEFGEMDVRVSNLPSPSNPRTSYLAAMSAVAAIRKFKDSVVIG
jgi:aspartate dehydrogenase